MAIKPNAYVPGFTGARIAQEITFVSSSIWKLLRRIESPVYKLPMAIRYRYTHQYTTMSSKVLPLRCSLHFSSQYYIPLSTLLLPLSTYIISIILPKPSVLPKSNTKFYSIPPPLPRDAIAPVSPAHCTLSHIFLFRQLLP